MGAVGVRGRAQAMPTAPAGVGCATSDSRLPASPVPTNGRATCRDRVLVASRWRAAPTPPSSAFPATVIGPPIRRHPRCFACSAATPRQGLRLRLFVAAWPPADVVAAIAALERPEVTGLRWTTEDQWHVTLRFLGEYDIEEATDALAPVVAERTSAVMGPVTGRFGQRILHVPVAGIDDAAEAVAVAFGPEERPFNGHLTLARARERRGVDLRPFCGVPLTGEWPVEDSPSSRASSIPRAPATRSWRISARSLKRTDVRNYLLELSRSSCYTPPYGGHDLSDRAERAPRWSETVT